MQTRKTEKCVPGKCKLVKLGSKTKIKVEQLRQGMTNQLKINKVTKYLKVHCKKCGRITWLDEERLPDHGQEQEVKARGERLDQIEAVLAGK